MRTGRLALAAAGAVACAAVVVAGAAATAQRTTASKRTIYAVATRAQFVNIADGITRGDVKNPFNADVKLMVPKPNGKGPLPGDTALFSFKLYTSAARKNSVGTASYTCTYTFGNKGTCEAYFDLKNGTIFATGPVDFSASTFSLAITGGTSAYLGADGQIGSIPVAASGKPETRLDFDFTS